MYLYINTTERDSFTIALIEGDRVAKNKIVKSERKHSEKLLKSIQALLKSAKAALSDIKGVAAVKGPGSFTSLRIGIATANALAYGLGIPVIGVSSEQKLESVSKLFARRKSKRAIHVVVPEYGREPDIIMKKRG